MSPKSAGRGLLRLVDCSEWYFNGLCICNSGTSRSLHGRAGGQATMQQFIVDHLSLRPQHEIEDQRESKVFVAFGLSDR